MNSSGDVEVRGKAVFLNSYDTCCAVALLSSGTSKEAFLAIHTSSLTYTPNHLAGGRQEAAKHRHHGAAWLQALNAAAPTSLRPRY